MKIVVTGAAGFIGSHLVSALAGAGHVVTCIVEPGTKIPEPSSGIFSADIVSGEGLQAGLNGIDGVVHLAARNHIQKETAKDPLSAYRLTNVVGTRNVVRAAVEAGARWFIHFSSVKAMGEGGDVMFDEDSPCHPETPYGISKLESEEVVRNTVEKSGLRAIILRLPMAYGPRNSGNLPRMIRWADRGFPFPLLRPENMRSMVYVGNVMEGVRLVIEKALPGVSTFMLKDAEDYSPSRVYATICQKLGRPPRFLPVPGVVMRIGGILSEDFRKVTSTFRVNSSKAKKELGYSPPFSLEEGIAETVEWYKRSE